MRAVSDWEKTDLEALISNEADEGIDLEFKSSAALINNPKNKSEMIKDLCAFANAAGGTIIYGICEKDDGRAGYIDEGSPSSVTQEWIEQIISSNIEPKIQGIIVKRIWLNGDNSAFAIQIPKSVNSAPHQSRIDQKYYRRWGKITQAMFDHEIRDLMRRSETPELYLDWNIEKKENHFSISSTISNRSNSPALYGITNIYLDADLKPRNYGEFQNIYAELIFNGDRKKAFQLTRLFATPGHLPIFNGQKWSWFDCDVDIEPNSVYAFCQRIACPGFHETIGGQIVRIGDSLPHIELKTI